MDPPASSYPALGCRAGPYELLRVLEQEGAGHRLYLARDDRNGDVALKVLRGAEGHSQGVWDGEGEGSLGGAQSTRAVVLPAGARVVQVVAAWREPALSGCHCLAASPFWSGGSLQALIESRPGRPVALRTRLRWALEVAETLLLLHDAPGARQHCCSAVTPGRVALCSSEDGERVEAFLLGLSVEGWMLEGRSRGLGDMCHQQQQQQQEEEKEEEEVSDSLPSHGLVGDCGPSADVWSWGVLLWSLLSWSMARLDGADDQESIEWFASLQGRYRAEWSEELLLLGQEEEEEGQQVLQEKRLGTTGREQQPEREEQEEHQQAEQEQQQEQEASLELLAKEGHAETQQQCQHHCPQQDCHRQRELEVERGRGEAVVRLMLACFLDREEKRAGLAMVVHGMRRALGYHEAPTLLVWLQQRLGEARAVRGGGSMAEELEEELDLLLRKAAVHKARRQLAEERACLELGAQLARRCGTAKSGVARRSLLRLAWLYQSQGEQGAAMLLYDEVLPAIRANLPTCHADLAACLHNLATLHHGSGEKERALALYRRALGIIRAALPPRPAETVTCLHNLALLHDSQGQHDMAVPLLQEAVELGRAGQLPMGQACASLDRLAALWQHMGEHGRALVLYEEVLALRRAALPAHHLDIAASLTSLAWLHEGRGGLERALALCQEAVEASRWAAALPPSHPGMAIRLATLAQLHHHTGGHGEEVARVLYEEALAAMRAAAVPPANPHLIACLDRLARLHQARGDNAAALRLYEEAVESRRQGAEARRGRASTGHALHQLAGRHVSRGEYCLALPLYEEALAVRRAVLPAGHPGIAASLDVLAAVHESMGQYGWALPLYQEALAIRRVALPPCHPGLANSLDSIVRLYRQEEHYGLAISLCEEALSIRRAALPAHHHDTAACLFDLAVLHQAKGDDYALARQLYSEALRVREAAMAADLPEDAVPMFDMTSLNYGQEEKDI